MPILIKRYANRKLYNTESSRYITLKGIAKLLDEGEEVRVIDNETGEDITQVALSQILVGKERAREDPSDTLLSQILSKGGDALYDAIKKSVDDASEGLGEFQDRFRKMVDHSETLARNARDASPFSRAFDSRSNDDEYDAPQHERSTSPFAPRPRPPAKPREDPDQVMREAITQILESYDLPQRSDLERLNRNLERVANALEKVDAISDTDSEEA